MTQQLNLRPGGTGGADASLYSGTYAEVNLGSQVTTPIGATTIVKGTTYCRYLVRFDVSGIPARSAIQSARLTLTKNSGTYPDGAQFQLRRVTRADWTELGATWNLYDGTRPWTTPGGDFADQGGILVSLALGDTGLVFPDISNLVTDAIALREGSLVLLVTGNEAATSEFVNIHTADEPILEKRPLLEIEYIEPPALEITDHADGSVDQGVSAFLATRVSSLPALFGHCYNVAGVLSSTPVAVLFSRHFPSILA